MKRTAFTLVELLVVIGIIALLVAILAPSLGRARSLARSAVCKHNLKELYSAFVASANLRMNQGAGSNVRRLYPTGPSWPATPMNALPFSDVYRCPEDELITGESCLDKLVYWFDPPGGVQVDLSKPDSGAWYISRPGTDENGPYRDYVIQDDGGTGGMSFSGWVDIDGAFRIYYDTGLILIYATLPDTPEWNGASPRSTSSCGDPNYMYYNGKPAFGTDGCIRTYRGQDFYIEGWRANTNYGINSLAHQSGSPDNIVLLDCKKLVADPTDATATHTLLHNSARHLGKLNYLSSDGSVAIKIPVELYPDLFPTLWFP